MGKNTHKDQKLYLCDFVIVNDKPPFLWNNCNVTRLCVMETFKHADRERERERERENFKLSGQ